MTALGFLLLGGCGDSGGGSRSEPSWVAGTPPRMALPSGPLQIRVDVRHGEVELTPLEHSVFDCDVEFYSDHDSVLGRTFVVRSDDASVSFVCIRDDDEFRFVVELQPPSEGCALPDRLSKESQVWFQSCEIPNRAIGASYPDLVVTYELP